jgi:Tfp pilus assembly protein PilO
MDRNRIKLIIAMVSGVAVLALGFLLGVQPQLSAASAAAEQKASVDQQNEGIRAAVEQLIAENEGLAGLEDERDAKLASVPAAPDMPALIRQLDQMAGEAGTMVTSFTTADPVSYVAPASATAPAAAAPAEGTESSEGTDGSADAAAAAPAEAALPTAPATVTDPAVTTANFSTIAVTVDIQGSYDQALDFVDRIQKGPRLFLVTAITSSEPEEGSETAEGQTWTVGGLVFVLQDGDTAPADGDATTTAPTQAEGTDEGTDTTASGR